MLDTLECEGLVMMPSDKTRECLLIAVVVPNTARGWERKNRPCRVRTKILEREGTVS